MLSCSQELKLEKLVLCHQSGSNRMCVLCELKRSNIHQAIGEVENPCHSNIVNFSSGISTGMLNSSGIKYSLALCL